MSAIRVALQIARQNPLLVPDLRLMLASILVPSGDEVALLTQTEYLKILNPEGKRHPLTSYEITLDRLNHASFVYSELGNTGQWLSNLEVFSNDRGYILEDQKGVVATIIEGVIYTIKPYASIFKTSPIFYYHRGDTFEIPFKAVKVIKYPYEGMTRMDSVIRDNLKSLSAVMQRYKIKGESFELRTSTLPYVKDSGNTIALLNGKGQLVGRAVNEWGATLVQVADEYRGYGLGKILASRWSEYNPSYNSGGFTGHGLAMSQRLWEDQVRAFLAKGGYSALLRQGLITQERIQEILKDLSGRRHTQPVQIPQEAPP